MLPQPLPASSPVTGPPLSLADQVRQAARSRNTQRAYHGHWNRFRSWALERGLDLPEGLEAALCGYLVHLAGGVGGWPPSGRPGRPSSRAPSWRGGRGPRAPASRRRCWGWDGCSEDPRNRRRLSMPRPSRRSGPPPPPTPHPGRSYRDGEVRPAPRPGGRRPGLRHAGRAAAGLRGRRAQVGERERAGDGSGRIRIAESQGDQEGDGVVLYLGRAAVQALLAIRPGDAAVDGSTRVFGLHPDTIRRRLQQAAQAAGLPGWREITGHSGRVGMAQDLSAAGFGLPELMTAGRWKSPKMPARYTERQEAGRGAVARYYQRSRGVEARSRCHGKRVSHPVLDGRGP